jgi:hypothetical protein
VIRKKNRAHRTVPAYPGLFGTQEQSHSPRRKEGLFPGNVRGSVPLSPTSVSAMPASGAQVSLGWLSGPIGAGLRSHLLTPEIIKNPGQRDRRGVQFCSAAKNRELGHSPEATWEA